MQPFISHQYKFTVIPFVGMMKKPETAYAIQASEVDYILEMPLRALVDAYNPFGEYHYTKEEVWKGPVYNISNKYIYDSNGDDVHSSRDDKDVMWGLTARILTNYFYLLTRK